MEKIYIHSPPHLANLVLGPSARLKAPDSLMAWGCIYHEAMTGCFWLQRLTKKPSSSETHPSPHPNIADPKWVPPQPAHK